MDTEPIQQAALDTNAIAELCNKATYASVLPEWSMVRTVLAELEATRERAENAEKDCDAYKKAKEENDERFMLERDAARAEVQRLTSETNDSMLRPKLVEHVLDNDDGWKEAVKGAALCPTLQSAIALRLQVDRAELARASAPMMREAAEIVSNMKISVNSREGYRNDAERTTVVWAILDAQQFIVDHLRSLSTPPAQQTPAKPLEITPKMAEYMIDSLVEEMMNQLWPDWSKEATNE